MAQRLQIYKIVRVRAVQKRGTTARHYDWSFKDFRPPHGERWLRGPLNGQLEYIVPENSSWGFPIIFPGRYR